MPNNSYLRSTAKEREIVNKAREAGLISLRSAGSHSPIDVVVVDMLNKCIDLVQVKVKLGCSVPVIKNEQVTTGWTVSSYTKSWEKRKGDK